MIIKPLSSIAKNISSGLTPLRSNPLFWVNPTVPWLKTEQLGNKYIFDTKEYISEEAVKKNNMKIFPKNTLSIAMYGEGKTRGNLSILKTEMATNQACCNIEIDPEYADFEYVYYFLKTQYQNIRNLSSGIRKNLNSNDIKNYLIYLPDSKQEQVKISSVLMLIDQKIELNNCINAELEAMAKTLYDYWFVQFDFPNEEGKPYKSSGGKMVYNTTLKQEIPDGWIDKQLNSVVERIGTGLNPRDNFKLGEGNNYYITIKDIEQGRIIFSDKTDRISDVTLDIINKRSDIKAGDILFTSIQPVGLTYLIHEKPVNWNINESVFTIRANQSLVTSEYLFKLLSSEQMKVFSKNSSSGSIHKGIRHGVLKTFVFAYANLSLINKFTEMITPLLQKQYKLEIENNNLQSLRDFLLPMLMNGQVTVK